MERVAEQVQKRGRGRPMIGTQEEAAERRRALTRARVQALRQRQKQKAEQQAAAEQQTAEEALRRRIAELEREAAALRADLASAQADLSRLRTPAPPPPPPGRAARDLDGATFLRSFVDRIERLSVEKKKLRGLKSEGAQAERRMIDADIRRVYDEACGLGFEAEIIEQVVRLRAMPADKRHHRQALLELYMKALGME